MKVKELKAILNQCDDGLEIFIDCNGVERASFGLNHVQNIDDEQIKTEKYVIREK